MSTKELFIMRRFMRYIPALIVMALLLGLATSTAHAEVSPSHPRSVAEDNHAWQNGDEPVGNPFVISIDRQGVSFPGLSSSLETDDIVDQVSVSLYGRDLPAGTDHGEDAILLDWEQLPVNPRGSHTFLLPHLVPSGLPEAEEPDTVIWEAPSVNRQQVAHSNRGSVAVRLAGLFSAVEWARPSDWLYWALRLAVFGLVALLFVARRIRKSRWPDADLPEVGTVTTLPSNLPAPVVSVLGSRRIVPQTYLSILLDLLQRGNLTITATSCSDNGHLVHSQVAFARQFAPDQPWEKVVYDSVPSDTNNSKQLKARLERQRRSIRAHLDEHLQDLGIFDGPPLQAMAEQGQGPLAKFGWFLAAVILGLGVGLWINLWLPWWAGGAIGIPATFVFFRQAMDRASGRLAPTSAGALEISRWFAFSESLSRKQVEPSLDPSQPDPLLPYAVALNAAAQWVNNFRTLPPWFQATGGRRIPAYRGFVGADSWDLSGGPNIEPFSSSTSRAGGGGGDAGGGDGGG